MTFDRLEVADGNNDFLNLLSQFPSRGEDECLTGLDIRVDLLEDGDGECSSLSSAGLSLGNDVGTWTINSVCRMTDLCFSSMRTLDDWHNSTLLDSRWALETIGIDTCVA